MKFIYVILGLIVAIIIAITIFNISKNKEFCGNGICEYGENSNNCCIDCGCDNGYKCENNTCIEVKPICGDGICSPNENCYDCPKDCKCKEGEYCSDIDKKCIKPICGNGKCEPFESFDNCCDDCPCGLSWLVCNNKTHKCEYPKINITKDEAVDLIRKFYENYTIESIDNITMFYFNNNLGFQAKVKLKGYWYRYVFVSENRSVVELPVVG